MNSNIGIDVSKQKLNRLFAQSVNRYIAKCLKIFLLIEKM